MAIESIISNAAVYQGSASGAAAATKTESRKEQPKVSKGSVAEDTVTEHVPDTADVLSEAEDAAPVMQKSNRQLEQAVEKMKKNLNAQTEAVFGIHDGTNRVMIKIVDKDTKDVIKEYPPEKTLDMIQKVWEMAGIMVDEKR